MDGPIDTLNYMIAGYAVIFGGLLLYVVSLFWRSARLRRELELLDELDEKE